MSVADGHWFKCLMQMCYDLFCNFYMASLIFQILHVTVTHARMVVHAHQQLMVTCVAVHHVGVQMMRLKEIAAQVCVRLITA